MRLAEIWGRVDRVSPPGGTGVVFSLYYRLIADIGPTEALNVTFLMPVFTMFWAALFLGETMTAVMSFGCALILAGTALAVARR